MPENRTISGRPLALEFKELDADRGYIGIQAECKACDFRNIRIQELPHSDGAGQR